ncbi:MAG: pilin [Candidatus Falkowbacteria bacterium]
MKIGLKRFSVLSFLLILSCAWFVTATQTVSAAVPQYGMDTVGSVSYGTTQSGATDVRTIAARIINVTLSLLAIIVVSLIIFSGYQWMTAGGDEKVIDTAKSRMSNAVIGLVIVLAAWGISTFVMSTVLNVAK